MVFHPSYVSSLIFLRCPLVGIRLALVWEYVRGNCVHSGHICPWIVRWRWASLDCQNFTEGKRNWIWMTLILHSYRLTNELRVKLTDICASIISLTGVSCVSTILPWPRLDGHVCKSPYCGRSGSFWPQNVSSSTRMGISRAKPCLSCWSRNCLLYLRSVTSIPLFPHEKVSCPFSMPFKQLNIRKHIICNHFDRRAE